MLIPQFSIRWMLAVTAACAGVFTVVGLGVRGHTWAVGVSVAIAALAILMLVYAFLFGLVWAYASLTDRRGRKGRQPAGSPFAPSPPQAGNRPPETETPATPVVLE